MSVWRKLRTDERGVAMITAIAAVIGSLVIAVLAVDIGTMMLAKTQLQNAADAAALAAAREYYLSGGDQATAEGEAILLAGLNAAVEVNGREPVVIDGSDVTFHNDTVTVVTHRRGDHPVGLHFMKMVDPGHNNEGEVTASASALSGAVSGSDCFRPFAVPDRFQDNDSDEVFTPGIDFYDREITGYKVPNDLGHQIVLKYDNSSTTPRQGWFQPICFGPLNTGDPVLTGADIYRTWISDSCEPWIISIDDELRLETGNMVGPTRQGLGDLIDRDPGAQWDPATNTVINSAHDVSPRIVKIIAYDPELSVSAGHGTVFVSNLLLVFVEGYENSTLNVTCRFVQLVEENGPICPECPPGFLWRTALVQ